MADKPFITFQQAQAAMKAMADKAVQTGEPVAMAIVDDAGDMIAYACTDNLRLYSRRHAIRKAYTSAILGLDTGPHGEHLKKQGRSISEMGDPNLTHGQGGLVVRSTDGVIMGGIGVGGYPSGPRDEDLSRAGLDAMNI